MISVDTLEDNKAFALKEHADFPMLANPDKKTAFAYGVILQAVEVSTAIIMGMPALLKEGMSWREIKMRAMHATPVKLPERPSRGTGRTRSAARAEG